MDKIRENDGEEEVFWGGWVDEIFRKQRCKEWSLRKKNSEEKVEKLI